MKRVVFNILTVIVALPSALTWAGLPLVPGSYWHVPGTRRPARQTRLTRRRRYAVGIRVSC
jgi:hypothetical protein